MPSFYNRHCTEVPKPLRVPIRKPNLSRIFDLAKPKQVPEGYIEDRRSVYWVDKLPPQPPTVFDISPRLAKLIPHKDFHSSFEADRPTPMWTVSKAALNCPIKEVYTILSQPKNFDKYFEPDRDTPPYPVSKAALQYIATERIKNLAIPKRRYAPPEFDIFTATWYTRPPARRSVFTCNAIQDLELLAWPKSLRPALVNDQASSWGEPLGLTSENVSSKLAEYSQSKPNIDFEGFDPDSLSTDMKNAVAAEVANILGLKN